MNVKHPIKRQILRDITTVSRCALSLVELELENYNVSQIGYMLRIVESPGCNQNDLARMMKVNKTAVSKALTQLEDKGFITREKDENDLRSYKVYPTEKLLEVYPVIYHPLVSVAQKCFTDFTQEEINLYNEMTLRIKKNANRYWLACYNYDDKYVEIDKYM